MADRLKGKVALITGSGWAWGGGGGVVCGGGARIVVADIDGKAAQETVALVEKVGGRRWR
jgi:hypothetical protein